MKVLCAAHLLLCAMLWVGAEAAPKPSADTVHKIHIAHINDVHNRIEQASGTLSPCTPDIAAVGKCFGGYGRISTAVKQFRRAAKSDKAAFYFLNAGDEFTGTLWDTLFKGQITAELQRSSIFLKPNAQTFGNHEFDFGPEKLADYVANTTHRFTSCNTNASAVPRLAARNSPWLWLGHPYLRIAVVGWTTPDTSFMSSPGPVKFAPIIESVQAVVADLLTKNVDIIIGLSHGGYESDLAVAAAVPGLDLIVGGHSHYFLANPGSAPITDKTTGATDAPVGPYPTYVATKTSSGADKQVPVVTAYWGSKYMGLLKLSWSKATGLKVQSSGPVLLGGSNSSRKINPDPAVAKVIAPYKPAVDAVSFQVIGYAKVDLDGVRDNVRSRETNLGDLVADSMLLAIKSLPGFEAKFGETFIAIQNGGGVRAPIPAGNVTLGAVIAVLPFGNVVSVVRVDGSALVAAAQNGVSGFPGQGRFPQVAGLRIFHNNATLLSAYLLKDGQQLPIDPAAVYNVVTNNFMATGGDGYTTLQAGEQIYPTGPPQDEVLAAVISGTPGGVAPQVEGRIINCAAIACGTETRDFVKAGCSCP